MSGFIQEDTDHVGDTVFVGGAPAKGKSAFAQCEDAAKKQIVTDFATHLALVRMAQKDAIKDAVPALERLLAVCAQRTGQSYKVRDLLYSLWNGQATSLLEIVAVDWAIKRDLLFVMLAFGSEPRGGPCFFYDAISDAFKAAGLFDWFREAHRAAEPT